MRKLLSILQNSLKFTLQELAASKLRTALSLTGVSIGIFCIIGVLATVNSLERNIQNEVAGLGSNSIYVDKFDYSGGPNQPFWKMQSRPNMKYEEAMMIKERASLAANVSFLLQTNSNISYRDLQIKDAGIYGIIPDQIEIQPLKFENGRYFSDAEFNSGSSVCIIGYENALSLFGTTEMAMGKQIDIKGRKISIVGVLKKEGKNFIGWDYDNCIMLPYRFCKTVFEEKFSNPIIIVNGKENVSVPALTDELQGLMRQIRKIPPTQESNFALNSVEAFSKAITGFFSLINVIGAIIGVISLIVGLFGIANIMFVTVKERTSIIGLKKAIGAKSRTILTEVLLEALVLCMLGGAIGLVLVWFLTLLLSGPLKFPVYISIPMLITTVIICVIVGILSGILPAIRAARLNPVDAIRSK